MAESSWPFDNADTSEAQYSYLARLIADTGVLGSPNSSDLKPYGDSSGMFVKIPGLPSFGVVRGFLYLNDTLLTKSIAAASSQQRVDTVVLKLDPAANTVSVQVKQGSPGSGAPGLTQTDTDVYEMPLADVTVRANTTTIAAGDVTDRRVFSSNRWGSWTSSARPTSPREGKAGYNYSLKAPEYWDGSNWRSFSTTTTDAGQLTGGTIPTARLDYGVLAAVRGDRSVDAPMNGDGVNGDWNSVLQPGAYRVYGGNTNQNAPAGAYMFGTLVVFGAGGSISSRTQVYYSHQSQVYTRTAWNGNDWGGWVFLVRSGDLDGTNSRVNALDASKATYDYVNGVRDALRNDYSNQRVYATNYAGKICSGNFLVSNFSKDSNTGNYIGYLDVGLPSGSSQFSGTPNIVATAQSADSGGVTAQITNMSATGFRCYVTRRNSAATGVMFVAVGN